MNLALTMLIIFGTAKLLAELFERLGQPGIVGEILAGILIGPAVMGWVAPSEFTATMAGLGVMFLLFRVGLEVDAPKLMKVGGTAFVVAASGVLLTFASGFLFYFIAGRTHVEALFLGAALCATSVGITAQVLASRGLLSTTAAQIILGAAIVDDILTLLLLGFLTSLANGHIDFAGLALTTVMAVAFIGLVAYWGRHAMANVVSRAEGNLQIAESEFAVAMVLLFALAALSAKIGVAAIIGAFLAGMALSKAAPVRVHDLTRGVTELFVPFFLAEIGLHVQLSVFSSPRSLLLACALVLLVVLAKVIGCGIGAWGRGSDVALRVSAGMVPRGEFSMVVAQAGLALHAISTGTYSLIVFVAVATATVTPPLLKRAFRKGVGDSDLAGVPRE